MNIKIMARGVGYLLVTGVFFGAGIALSNRPYPTAETLRPEPSATAALDAELAHCQAIGPQAPDDANCKAVRKADRRRLIVSGKLYRDRVTHSVPATPDMNDPASPLATELPMSAPPSPSMPDSSAPQPAADIAEQPQ
jgi:conjugative transfer region protein TrbK